MIHSVSQLRLVKGKSDSDRGIREMNFSLVKEVEIAGVQIWKAIEDINRVTVTKEDDMYSFIITDYLFTSFYQAAQGMERLLKVIIELYAYDVTDEKERAKIDELLYSHNHSAMSDFLCEKIDLKLKPTGRKLLKALTAFYLKHRHIRELSYKLNIFAYELNSGAVAEFALNSYYGDDLYDDDSDIDE